MIFPLLNSNPENLVLLMATCATLCGVVGCSTCSSPQFLQTCLFYVTYFFRKSLVNLWEVKSPKYEIYVLHWAYMFSKIMKDFRWQKYAECSCIETSQGSFHVRPHTFDAICVSPDYERPDIDTTIQFIKEQQRLHNSVLFIDVGANVGSYSIRIGNAFHAWKGLSIIAFEPFSSSYSLLKRNVRLNRLEGKVDVRNMALHSHEGTIPLYLNPLDPGSNSFLKREKEDTPELSYVKTICMDELMPEWIKKEAAALIIKLDVEGSEVDVLRGAEKFLQAHQQVLLLIEDFVNPVICQYLIDTGWHRVQKKTPYNSFWSR